jgi:predicted ATPase
VETPAHFDALVGLYAYVQVRGEPRRSLEIAEDALAFAQRSGEPMLLGIAHWLSGNAQWWLADLAVARRHLEEGVALYDAERDPAETARQGFDNGAACHAFLGRVLWHLGFPDQGLVHAEAAISSASAAAHPFSKSFAHAWAAALYQLRGEAELCQENAEAALAIGTEQVIPFFAAHGMVLGGWALAKLGQTEEGLARLRAGIDAYRAIGAKIEEIHWLALLVEICRETGRIEEALSTLREAFAVTEQTGIRCFEAELHRLEGELRLRVDDKQSQACFHRALGIARAQNAKSFELRAALSLACLWCDQGKGDEAHNLLAPVYSWFTEGFDTSDLKKAKGLLDELAS